MAASSLQSAGQGRGKHAVATGHGRANIRGGDDMKIGFIGLGNMGAPMAANLARAGHEVTGYDISAPCPEGVRPCESEADAVRGAEVVITMLPNGQILQDVADVVVPVMEKGAILLDCSTVD